jgi:mannose-6-phosphate isomerase
MALYPLLFRPIVKKKVWGSETWSLSGYGDDQSEVKNGFLKDNLLSEVLEVYMDDLVGNHVYDRYGNRFPLLFKFIDAQDDLSVQVHPSDEQAAPSGEMGKTEMWYVTQADNDASIIAGFSRNTNAEEVKQKLNDNSVMDLLQVVPVKKGDVAYIPAGTVHALRHGTQVAEIQETSDLTYRLYDYNRPGLDGKLRPLHIDRSLQSLHYEALPHPLTDYNRPTNGRTTLVEDTHFHTSLLCLTEPLECDYAALDSFVVYMCTEGEAVIRCNYTDEPIDDIKLSAGNTMLIPATLHDITILPKIKTNILEIYVP